ncbi:MAG: PTS transporter subunit EIIC [Spiroplasma sp.]
MKKNAQKIANEIVAIIEAKNIVSCTNCLTRLRLNLKPDSNIDLQKIKSLPEVIEILSPSVSEVQIVLGPGFAAKVTNALTKLINLDDSQIIDDGAIIPSSNTIQMKQKNSIQVFFTKFSKIFSPMIIGFIGAGILAGVAGIMQSAYGGSVTTDTAPPAAISWFNLFSLLLNIWKNAFLIIVGWRTAEIFGGSGVIGAMIATIYAPVFASFVLPIIITNNADISVNFLGIRISDPLSSWLTVGFRPEITNSKLVFGYPSGNILGVLLTAVVGIYLEKSIRKYMIGPLDTILTPTLTLFFLLLLNFFLLIPISGYMYQGISWFFAHLYANPIGAFILASVFLLTVAFGIHQGFIPIYAMLVDITGVNGLFPILAMAGMSQIGVGVALWLLAEKGSLLRKQIEGAIIPAFFGIGEPMIYGVTLPRIKPFVTTAIGAGIGGFFLGSILLWGKVNFGLNAMFGPSGFLAAFMMTTTTGNIGLAVIIFLSGAIISITSGLLITLFAYSRVATVGIAKIKQLYLKDMNQYSRLQKILWSFIFITIIGIFIFWILEYYRLPKEERIKIKEMKVE